MEPQLLDALIKYVTAGGSGAGGFFILFLAYKYLEKRRNGNGRKNSSTTISSGGVEIIGTKIDAMSSIMKSKLDIMIDEQKESRKLLSRTFEKIVEKPCIRGKI